MNGLFNGIGWIFGYVLWYAYLAVGSFAIAILIFTVILRVFQFPLQIKSQKSMAGSMRLQKKQQEIQEKYGRDREKVNEELSKLYEKENISPTGGCFTTLVPMFLLMGVYWTVRYPLTNTLHIASDKVSSALQSISALPGLGTSINSQYGEISIVKYFGSLQKYFVDGNGNALFSSADADKINEFGNGFNFLGLDLLATPSQSSFQSMMWLIPVLSFVTSVASMFIMQKLNGTKMQGCMVLMIFLMPLFTAWIAYSVPGAVGFYWITSTVLGFFQSLVMNKFYSPSIMEAKAEAQRIVLRREQEAKYEYIDVPDYEAPSAKSNNVETKEKSGKGSGKKQKSKKSGKNNNNSSYQGRKR